MSGAWLALVISCAGGVGAAARYLLDSRVTVRIRSRFPLGIMIVNLSGSLALGVVTGLAVSDPFMDVCAVGFLGGYTTFSTASFDSVRLLRERRYVAALLNGPGMLLACVGLATLGILITRN